MALLLGLRPSAPTAARSEAVTAPAAQGPPAAVPPADPSGSQYGKAIDTFRGFVCLSLTGMHFFGGFLDTFQGVFGPSLGWVAHNIRLGSESFFVLAGYFLARGFRAGDWQSLSVGKYLSRRVLRLAVPYWAAIALGLAGLYLRAAVMDLPPPKQGWRDAAAMALFIHDLVPTELTAAVLWFMAPLFQCYLLWGLAFWALQRWNRDRSPGESQERTVRGMVWLVGLLSVASLVVGALVVNPRWVLAGQAVYIGLGCFVHWTSRTPYARWWALAGGLAVLAATGVAVGDSRMVAACLAALALWWLAQHPQPSWANWKVLLPLSFVGAYSYSIYLTHMYVGPRVLHAGRRLGWDGDPGRAAVLLLAALVVTVAAAYLFHRVVEAPFTRMARRVSYRS